MTTQPQTQAQACCGNCRFSVPARSQDGKIDFRRRWCRWGPPTPMLVPGPQGPTLTNMWPTMGTTDNCGRHEFLAMDVILPGEVKPSAETAQ